jgi:hypothetical protein
MASSPCATCPFVKESPKHLRYDDDALYSLLDGMEPSCHSIVGAEIFAHGHWNDAPNPCMGYERFDPDDSSTWPEVAPVDQQE